MAITHLHTGDARVQRERPGVRVDAFLGLANVCVRGAQAGPCGRTGRVQRRNRSEAVDRFAVPSCFAQQIGQHRPGHDKVRCPRSRAPQQRLGIADPPLLAYVDAGQAPHRIDVVRILTQGVAQRVYRLSLAIGAQVIHRECDLSLARRLVEELFEGRIGLAASVEQRKRLPELLVRTRQSGFELDCPLEARHRLFVTTLQREYAAEILVQMREVRPQRQRKPHGLLGLRVARLLGKCMAKESQVLD